MKSGLIFYKEIIEIITYKWANTKPCTQKIEIEFYITL